MLAGRKDTRSSQSHPSSPLPAQSTVGERGALSVALGLKADKKVTKQQTGQAGTAIIMRPGSGQQAVTESAAITMIYFCIITKLQLCN